MPQRPAPDELRSRIDRGLAGDKVPAADPAAAPMNTDAAAAGAPLSPEQVALDADTQETIARSFGHRPVSETGETVGRDRREAAATRLAWLAFGAAVLAVLLYIT